jgi:Ca2+-transporting ATPase
VGYDKSISGDELLQLSKEQLQQCVKDTYLFTRMFPEAKLKIINALKANHEIVAMTGDGVNDGFSAQSRTHWHCHGRQGN